MPKRQGKIRMYMGPDTQAGPDDLRKAIIDFIDGARRTLDIAVQELDDLQIAQSIVAAKQRGVSVRIVCEADYFKTSRPRPNPFVAGGKHEVNRELQNALLRSAITVYSDFNPHIFHQKFIIRDGSAVLTGSTNFTTTGVTANLNHVVTVADRKVANVYKKEFAEIRRGHFGKRNEGHDEAPREVTVSGLPIKVLFAPDHAPEMEIMKQIAKATRRVDFAIFTFSKSSGVDDAMIQAKRAGVDVRGILDAKQANQTWAATRPVKNAGAELYVLKGGTTVGKVHHKLMVIDDQVVVVGSFNYTGPANALNDENIMIFGDLDTTRAADRNRQKAFAKYAGDEIDRMISVFGRRLR